MDKELIVKSAAEEVMQQLDKDILAQLQTTEIDEMIKGGSNTKRIRFAGPPRGRLWSKRYCFYEILVGECAAVHGAIAAVGFVCYPDRKALGHGIVTREVRQIVTDFSTANPKFRPSNPLDSHIGTHCYYKPTDTKDLEAKITTDLLLLIESTFPDLNSLKTVASA